MNGLAVATPAYKRKNKASIERAEQLVTLWYDDRVDHREHRYFAVRGRPAMPSSQVQVMNPGGKAWRPEPNPKGETNRYGNELEPRQLSATGTQTRAQLVHRRGLGVGIRLNVRQVGEHRYSDDDEGTYEVDRPLHFAQRVMLHIIAVDADLHRCLEMNAAGYEPIDIAAEIGSGEKLARQMVHEGLTVVVALSILRHDIRGWWKK